MLRLALYLALLIAAREAAEAAEAGQGELWLHHGVRDYYEVFKGDAEGHYFAVSTNGLAAGYSRCDKGRACSAEEGQQKALAICRAMPVDLPGDCHLYADKSGILWRGEVHVVDHQAWLQRLYGPRTVEESLARNVGHASGGGATSAASFAISEAIGRHLAFRSAPAGFALVSDECLYALEVLYAADPAPNFFLADSSGRFCGYATGYTQAQEAEAFAAALAVCEALAPQKGTCLVYAVDRTPLATRP